MGVLKQGGSNGLDYRTEKKKNRNVLGDFLETFDIVEIECMKRVGFK
jgi:hypothetical protein